MEFGCADEVFQNSVLIKGAVEVQVLRCGAVEPFDAAVGIEQQYAVGNGLGYSVEVEQGGGELLLSFFAAFGLREQSVEDIAPNTATGTGEIVELGAFEPAEKAVDLVEVQEQVAEQYGATGGEEAGEAADQVA